MKASSVERQTDGRTDRLH